VQQWRDWLRVKPTDPDVEWALDAHLTEEEHTGITPAVRDALLKRKNNFFLAPYEYDYLDPSNFYDLFRTGGRHHISFPEYDKLVNAGDAEADWNKRLDDYAKAEQVIIDNAALVPLVHPVTIDAVSDKLHGAGIEANSKGFTPLDRLEEFLYTHITKQ